MTKKQKNVGNPQDVVRVITANVLRIATTSLVRLCLSSSVTSFFFFFILFVVPLRGESSHKNLSSQEVLFQLYTTLSSELTIFV